MSSSQPWTTDEAGTENLKTFILTQLIPPPDHAFLDRLSNAGRCADRTGMDARVWRCPGCLKEYNPLSGLLIDLPWPACTTPTCGHQNRDFFEFIITDMVLKNVRLSMPVYSQGNTAHCAIYASATVAQLSKKIEWAMQPGDLCLTYTQSIDMVELSTLFHETIFHSDPSEGTSAPLVLLYLRSVGAPVRRSNLSADPTTNLRIRYFYMVDPADIYLIARMLASAIPLVGVIVSGRRMDFATVGEVYLPPPPGLLPTSRHSVALVGAAKRMLNGTWAVAYAAQDSHSIFAHANGQQGFDCFRGSVGGKFQVFGEHVLEVFGVVV